VALAVLIGLAISRIEPSLNPIQTKFQQ
jgi:hypothetical protein